MSPAELIEALKTQGVAFETVMAVIEAHYDFTPTGFQNGDQYNEPGTNNGSCKIFAFAKLHQLDEQSTLNAFGDYYYEDVLNHPQAKDHANIRNFMKSGWLGIQFEGDALQPKAA